MHPAIERYIDSMADAQSRVADAQVRVADAKARSQYLWLGGFVALLGTVSLLWITGARDMVQSLSEYWKAK